jgi:hypothetical protein
MTGLCVFARVLAHEVFVVAGARSTRRHLVGGCRSLAVVAGDSFGILAVVVDDGGAGPELSETHRP